MFHSEKKKISKEKHSLYEYTYISYTNETLVYKVMFLKIKTIVFFKNIYAIGKQWELHTSKDKTSKQEIILSSYRYSTDLKIKWSLNRDSA